MLTINRYHENRTIWYVMVMSVETNSENTFLSPKIYTVNYKFSMSERLPILVKHCENISILN